MVDKIQKDLVGKIKRILEVFAEDKNILVAGYAGSVSKGFADEYSDLDIVCLTEQEPEYPLIKKKLDSLSSDIEVFKEGKKMSYHFDYQGTIATVSFKRISEIYDTIKSLKEKFDLQIYKKLYTYLDYKVIFGDKEIIKKIQEQIPQKVPDKIIKDGFEDMYKWVVNNIRRGGRLEIEIKRENWISVNHRFNRTLAWFIELLYLINGVPFQEVRWIYKEIPRFEIKPRDCINKLDQIAKLGGGLDDAKKKIELLRTLVFDLDVVVRKKGFDVLKLT